MKTLLYIGVALVGLAVVYTVVFIGFAMLIPVDEFRTDPIVEPKKVADAYIPNLVERLTRTEAENAVWKMTLAKYNALKTGMTYEEVVKVIGREGEELSRNEIAGITTVIYQWQNKSLADLGGANAMFQNNNLIEKSQFNLKE
jgi:hypothetical protein